MEPNGVEQFTAAISNTYAGTQLITIEPDTRGVVTMRVIDSDGDVTDSVFTQDEAQNIAHRLVAAAKFATDPTGRGYYV